VKPPSKQKANKVPAEPERSKDAEPDIAILGGPTEDGQGAHLLRLREGTLSTGEIRPVREGEPVTHRELVRLHPLDEDKRVCRVETLHAPPEPPTTATERPRRPARVSNARYRKNWDAIFDSDGKKGDWSLN